MKHILARILCAGLLLATTPVLAASDGIAPASGGAGVSGLTMQVSYDLGHMHYSEKSAVDGSRLDTDSGWLQGGYAEMRYDFTETFVRGRFAAIGSDSARYDGSLQNGSPYRAPTKEGVYAAEIDVAYKLWDQEGSTFAPYLGVGYRFWRRGENVLPSYQEDYTWGYGAAGINYALRYEDFIFGLDLALLYPFATRMTTDVSGQYDKATFNIKPLPGCRVELPISYDILRTKDLRMFVSVTPYFEHWQIGRSSTVQMTRGGAPVPGAVFYEPKSTTDVQGVRMGLGVTL